jgi:hypothetical protein
LILLGIADVCLQQDQQDLGPTWLAFLADPFAVQWLMCLQLQALILSRHILIAIIWQIYKSPADV